jgi:hypothetical protein
MTYWYSPGERRFGLKGWGKKARPADAVDVSAERHAELFPDGVCVAEIVPDADGNPVHRVDSVDEQRASAIRAVKIEARRRIETVMPLYQQINALRGDSDGGSSKAFALIDAIRTASNLIEQDLRDSDCPQKVPIADHPLWLET